MRSAFETPTTCAASSSTTGEPEPVTVSEEELAATRALRERLRVVFETHDPALAAETLNALLASAATRPYLSDHDGTPWHLHVARDGADWAEWLAAATATGLAVLAAEQGFERLRVCAAAGCDTVFVDTSRNHTRRFCTQACATRARVTAHRLRQRRRQR